MPNGQDLAEKPAAAKGAFIRDPRVQTWLFGLSAALAVFLFYLPTVSFDFVNLDDPQCILQNSLIHNHTLEGLGKLFTTFHEQDWMPLTWLSLALNDMVSGPRPWSYHLANNLLHAANTLLVFLVVKGLLGAARKPETPAPDRPAFEDWTALLSAVLFGLHPVHVESVAWVTERKDVLYAFFFLASILSYIPFATRKGRPILRYTLCFGLFLLSLLAKTAAVSLPLVLLILDIWPLRRFQRKGWKRTLLEKTPFLLASFLVGILSIRSHKGGPTYLPLAQMILKPLYAFFFYLWKAFVPYGLSPLYPTLPLVPVYIWGTCCLGLLFLGLGWVSFRYRREQPGLLAAFLFYLVTMAPNLQILIMGGHEGVAAADHYTYIPLLALFVPLAAWTVGKLQPRPWTLPLLALLLTAWLGSLTLAQASLWRDNNSLWEGAAKVYPHSALIRLELGNDHLNNGHLNEAETDFEFVREVQPGLPSAYRGLALVELRRGQVDEAITNLQKALSIDGTDPQAWVYLWKGLTQKGRHPEALETMKTAVQKDPDSALFWNLLGSSYGYLGKPKESVQAFRTALKLDPGNPDYLLNLGDTYLNFGMKSEAADTYQEAIQGSPGSEAIPCLVGESYLRSGMAKEALGPLETAWGVKQAPRIAGDLSRAYRLMGQKKKEKEYEDLAKGMNKPRSLQGLPKN